MRSMWCPCGGCIAGARSVTDLLATLQELEHLGWEVSRIAQDLLHFDLVEVAASGEGDARDKAGFLGTPSMN